MWVTTSGNGRDVVGGHVTRCVCRYAVARTVVTVLGAPRLYRCCPPSPVPRLGALGGCRPSLPPVQLGGVVGAPAEPLHDLRAACDGADPRRASSHRVRHPIDVRDAAGPALDLGVLVRQQVGGLGEPRRGWAPRWVMASRPRWRPAVCASGGPDGSCDGMQALARVCQPHTERPSGVAGRMRARESNARLRPAGARAWRSRPR